VWGTRTSCGMCESPRDATTEEPTS
jgi:hypothetical protein